VLNAEPGGPDREEEREREERARREARDTRLRVLEVVFAGAVAFFALVQAGVSYWQWDVMKKGLAQTRDSNALTQKANRLTQRSNNLARQQMEAGQRATIVPKRAGLSSIVLGKPFDLGIELANYGNGVAIDVTTQVQIRLERRDGTPIEGPGLVPSTGSAVMGPGVPHVVNYREVEFSPETWGLIRQNELRVFVQSFTQYRDQIGPHESRGCFEVFLNKTPPTQEACAQGTAVE
jgi:hypothetical protein